MPDRKEYFTVEKSLPGGRLDVFLRTKFPAASRGALQRLIEQGHIRVNGQTTKPTHSPRAGEEIEIHWPEARPAEAQPEEMPLDILFEDQSLLVLNKPAGLVVHPAAGHEEHTLVNALLHHCAGELSGIGGVARPGIVHRLDKETSGCLVVAKNDGTHLALSKQFAERRVEKIYNAIVCGELARDSGEIRARHRAASVAPQTHGRARRRFRPRRAHELACSRKIECSRRLLRRKSTPAGRTKSACISNFSVIRSWAMSIYGAKQNKRLAELTGYAAPRVMLHARELSFIHPRTEKEMSFESPLPEDFRATLKQLR